MGDEDISKRFRENLEHDLQEFHTLLLKLAELYKECRNQYSSSMHESLNQVESYSNENELIKLHQEKKKSAIDKV